MSCLVLLPPSGRRALLSTGPGPDTGGSNPGKYGWTHMPEKSGMAATSCVALTVGPGGGVCPEAGAEATATNSIDKRQSRRRMIFSHLLFAVVVTPMTPTF